MRRVRLTATRTAQAAALALALLALALSLRSSLLFLPLLGVAALTMASPFLEWTSVPDPLRRGLPRLHVFLLLMAGGTAWLSRSMGVLLLEPTAIPAVAAPVLVPIWASFALAPRAFPAGRTLLPGAVAVLTFAGLNPTPEGYGASFLPFPRDGARNAFAEVYLGLALLVVVTLWVTSLKDTGPRWSRRTLGVVAVSGVVMTTLTAAAIVGLPLLQPHVEQAFAEALSQGATTGLAGESTLGEFESLAHSRRRVLDLQTSLAWGGSWRLPAEVFTRFDGRRWSNAPLPRGSTSSGEGAGKTVPPGPLRPGPAPPGAGSLVAHLGSWFSVPGVSADAAVGSPPVQMRVTQARTEEWPLLLPRDPLAVTASSSHLQLDRFGLVRRVLGLPLRQYGAVLGGRASARRVVDLSPADREESLSLPEKLDPRVVALASALAPADADPREVLAVAVHHLQTRYDYTLSPGPFRPGGDPLAEFLFEKKKAYCEYFASAAVVLLRLRGVPARFVKGLSVGPQNDMGGGLHVLRESDAHAWVEAWIPGEGWVEADPTPPGQFAEAHGAPGTLQQWRERLRAGLAGAWARLLSVGPLAFLRWLGGGVASLVARAVRDPLCWLLAAVVVLGPAAWRRLRALRETRRRTLAREREAARVPAELRARVRDLERRWKAHGHPRPASRGLLEHASALEGPPPPGAPPLPEPLVDAGGEIVHAYYEARFGEGEVPAEDVFTRLRGAAEKRT
jgi:transglutaminase-like putative cysteine protease